MEESVIYQKILEEGRKLGHEEGVLVGERRILVRVGRKRLGELPPTLLEKIESIVEETTLFRLADRLFDASTWEELLGNV